jgi:N-acetylglutamate synthase-like GNAT family acetyltransferase
MSDAGFTIRRATREEAPEVARVIREAFKTVAEQIGEDIPPLHESAHDVEQSFDACDVVLVAEQSGAIVGTVRSESSRDCDVMVRRLAVVPEARQLGIARALMLALEDAFPQAQCFELFTGANAIGPLSLYESLGYRQIEPREQFGFPLVWLEKARD